MKQTRLLLLIGLLGAAAVGLPSLRGATITVTNTNDSGAGSLRQRLADANDGDAIDFSVTTPATITLTSGELLVNKSVTITGPGADQLSVDGNGRAFSIVAIDVTISGLTITNGSEFAGGAIYNYHSTLTVSNCTLSGNFGGEGGGAIYNDGAYFGSATLTINNCTLSGNSTSYYGGGIYNDGTFSGSATLTVNNSTLSGNFSYIDGGGISNDGYRGSATLTINNSTLSGNSVASGIGGGIVSNGVEGSATLTISNSTLSGNSAATGGGIYNNGGFGSVTLTINNCTLSGNSAGDGGGIYNDGVNGGSATLVLNNSTLSGNSAAFGGGIYNIGVDGSATLTIGDTILNTGVSGENILNYFGTVASLGYNLSNDDGGGLLTATGDLINTDPMLGPLQDNSGPTFTHALLPGSPAIDAGDPNFDPYAFNPPMLYDQRGAGFSRVLNGRIDIGAFEAQPGATPSYAAQIQPPINADGTSIFSVRRGVVPVKFTLTQGGVATCDLPPATIAVTRTGGGVIGQVNESVYSGNADTGSNFRIDSCQYVYNLNSRALGVGTYRVDILIDGQPVGSAAFQLQ
jgi:hypothetical protein